MALADPARAGAPTAGGSPRSMVVPDAQVGSVDRLPLGRRMPRQQRPEGCHVEATLSQGVGQAGLAAAMRGLQAERGLLPQLHVTPPGG